MKGVFSEIVQLFFFNGHPSGSTHCPQSFSSFGMSTVIIVRILTYISGCYQFRKYFAAAAGMISIKGGWGWGGKREWGGEVGSGTYIRDLKVSTKGAATASGGRLSHSLMVWGKRESFRYEVLQAGWDWRVVLLLCHNARLELEEGLVLHMSVYPS